jgi:Stage II sporulation protein E (SpoIIE)
VLHAFKGCLGPVRTGDRLVFFTDGLPEARNRSGRFCRLDQQIETLRRSDLQAAADELLDRLSAHTRHRLDDIAVLLAELTLTDPGPGAPVRGTGRTGPLQAWQPVIR